MLLERESDVADFEQALAEARSAGRIVLVGGEAGIGKTTLVRSVLGAADGMRVLWGACDALVVARSLGPVHDVARQTGGALAEAVENGAGREPLLAALLDELSTLRPTTIAIEDLHWADEATLDVIALLSRRLPETRGCLVLTCRSEALAAREDVRRVLESLPAANVTRIEPAPLSDAAVQRLARRARRDAADLHAVTGGNPFLVTEVLASDDSVPRSVQGALRVRLADLPPQSRSVAELVSVVPGQAELWLVREAVHATPSAIDGCLAAGILELHDNALSFRHELARSAVEASLGPLRRRELNAAVLATLERQGAIDDARLAHHAQAAGDDAAIRRLAPAAAAQASRAGAHRQALAHWEAALAAGGDDPRALGGVAFEAYLCGRNDRALEARRTELDVARANGDRVRAGEVTRWIARLQWLLGRSADAAETVAEAVTELRSVRAGRELGMALSTRSQLAMLADRPDEAIAFGEESIALARRLNDRAVLAHALTNVGAARIGGHETERGRTELEQAFALAADDCEHAVRALANLAMVTQQRDPGDPRIGDDLERALAYAREHELDGPLQYLLGARAQFRLLRGNWDGAEDDARTSLATAGAGPGAGVAMLVLGRLRARRGDPDASATLDGAGRLADASGEPHRVAAVAAARAEHAWLEGDTRGVVAAVRDVDTAHVAVRHPLVYAELAFWLWRVGACRRPPLNGGGYGLSIAGDPRGAAATWQALGFPYETADAASHGDKAAALTALETFDRLGALAAARRLRRRLQARGVRRVPRGPRPASRAAPAGLTPRQVEVARLITTGATNAEIARALVVSPKTAAHHVSAVLAKLGLASRREVQAAVTRLGLTAI
jgi:DNA-binding CsgD family transcriptional regulator/tetratricopeptide (TPR) repeat protein